MCQQSPYAILKSLSWEFCQFWFCCTSVYIIQNGGCYQHFLGPAQWSCFSHVKLTHITQSIRTSKLNSVLQGVKKEIKPWTMRINARVKGHLEPTHLKSSPLFTFSTKLLGQDSPSVHLFSITIESWFTAVNIKLGEDSPSLFVFSRSRFTFK